MQTALRIRLSSTLLLCCSVLSARAITGFVEPWQVWVKQPIETPMVLTTIVKADLGTEVYFALGGLTYTNTGLGTGQSATNVFVAPLKGHQQYPVQVYGSALLEAEVQLQSYVSRQLLAKRGLAALPKAYRSFVGAQETNGFLVTFRSAASNATSFVLEARPDPGLRPAALLSLEDRWNRDEDASAAAAPGDGLWPELGPGRSTNAWSGAFRWAVSLGRLWNGNPCGMLRLDEAALGPSLYTAKPLSYTARSTNTAELMVITTNGMLRQVRTPQALVDLQSTNQPTEQCILRFYLLSQAGSTTNASGLFAITNDDPFVVWRIKNPDAAGTSNRVHFVEERAGRTNTSEVTYSNLVWALKTGSGSETRTETRTVSISDPVRTETVEVRVGASTAYKAVEQYARFAWGWELTNVVSNPDGSPVTNRFTYYDSPSELAGYRNLKDRWYPDGRWERHFYVSGGQCPSWPFGDAADYFGTAHYFEVTLRPWKDGPADPDSATLSNTVQTIFEYIDNHVGAHTSWSKYESLGDWNNETNLLSISTGMDSSSATASTILMDYMYDFNGSYQLAYRYECLGSNRHGLLCSTTRGDESAEYYEYAKGAFNWTNHAFTLDETNGPDFQVLATHGTIGRYGFAPPSLCSYGQPVGTYSVPQLHVGKSTQEIAVYQGGNLVYKKLLGLQAIAGDNTPVFSPMERRIFTCDSLGHVTNVLWMDALNTNVTRTVYQASWAGPTGRDSDLKSWEILETGEKLTYAYDSLKRLTNITRKGVSQLGDYPAQLDIGTNLVYDAAGRVTRFTVTSGSLWLSATNVFDLSGRVTALTGFDGATTNFSYSANGRTLTETRPGGVTLIRSNYLDGRLESISSNAVVNEFYDYFVTDHNHNEALSYDFPKNGTRIRYGTRTSERWREEITDLVGGLKLERFPGFNATPNDPPLEITHTRAQGILLQKWSPATMDGQSLVSHPEYYTPDGYGTIVTAKSGLAERTRTQEALYEHDGTNWFLNSYTAIWDGATFATNSTRQRLSGYTSTAVLAELTLADPYTNTSAVTVYLDRANKKVTAVTNTPQSAINATNVLINGLLQTASTESVASPTWFYYDALSRLTAAQDPLRFASTTAYDPNTGWVTSTTNPAGQTTSYQYYGPTEANAGRLKCRTDANGKKSWYDYTPRGDLQHVWGDVPYPEERLYSSFGELTELRTFQAGTAWPTPNTWPGSGVSYQSTTWTYDAPTGLLLWKLYADGKGYTNNYRFTRDLFTRTWARGVTVTNTFNEYGEPAALEYSDGTPNVLISLYNRLGLPETITDALGTRHLSYDFTGRLLSTSWDYPSPLSPLAVTNGYDALFGRNQICVLDSGSPLLVHDYGFDTGTGRMNLVSNGVCTAHYGYVPNSDLLQTTTFKNNGTNVLTTTRAWEYGFRMAAIVNEANGVVVSSFGYRYDSVSRHTQAVLEDGSTWSYDYNDRNELIGARRYWPDWGPVAGQHFGYAYDNIGNRKSAWSGGDTNGANLRETAYTANSLNQYNSVTTPGYRHIAGVAFATNAVTVNATGADRRGEWFDKEITIGNSSTSLWQNVAMTSSTVTSNGGFAFPKYQQTLAYDLDGNLSFDGIWAYEWDGENRLRTMTMTNIANVPDAQRKRLEFAYDYMGRRVQKVVKTWNGGGFGSAVTNNFVYDGWNLLLILDPQLSVLQSFLWGQDLSGTMGEAGGVGGLLAVDDAGGRVHFACYDGNGNVTALVNAANKLASARYEYSPFGELLRATGPMAPSNPHRWSTKFCDEESGLAYYGLRYYSALQGKWVGRDPEGERDCVNLYAFVFNLPNRNLDTLGEETIKSDEITRNIRGSLRLAFKIDGKLGSWVTRSHPYSYLQMCLWFGTGGIKGTKGSYVGKYDFKVRDEKNENDYYIRGRKVNNDQMGNYLAGYAAGFAMMETNDAVFWVGVQGAGILYAWQDRRTGGKLGIFWGDDWGSVSMLRSGAIDGAIDALFDDDEGGND